MEQQDDAEQARHDVDLIGDVGLVGRDDRYAEHVVEAGGEHREPHQRPHDRGQQAPALLHELHDLSHGDGAHGASGVNELHGRSPFELARRLAFVVAERVERVDAMQKSFDRRARCHRIRRGEEHGLP